MNKKPLGPILLDRQKNLSLQAQLALALKELIQTGALSAGDTIPSSRELARDLRISRNTVLLAYDRLVGEGYLDTAARSGVFVSESLAHAMLPKRSKLSNRLHELSPSKPLDEIDAMVRPKPFRPSQPDVRLFPLTLWNRMRARSLKRYGTDILNYHSELGLGLPALRQSFDVVFIRMK